MSSVSAITNTSKATADDVVDWHQKKAERGEIAANTAALRCSAIRQFVGILGDDEPREAEWVLSNLDSIARRWATKHGEMKGGTARSYESRVRTALEDYRRWQDDPTSFEFRRREVSERTHDVTSEKPAASKQASAKAHAPASSTLRSYPLGVDRDDFQFALPADGLTARDVARITCHLLTLATDFDPLNEQHATFVSLIAAKTR